jgi:hypothetical protein
MAEENTEPRWRIVIANATPATPVGHVHATTAIERAVKKLNITDPWKQKRLIPVRER